MTILHFVYLNKTFLSLYQQRLTFYHVACNDAMMEECDILLFILNPVVFQGVTSSFCFLVNKNS